MVAQYIYGLQGNDTRYVRANAGCKHFAVYAGPENIPSSRFSFDAKVSIHFTLDSFVQSCFLQPQICSGS
jgi:hypothetical protein